MKILGRINLLYLAAFVCLFFQAGAKENHAINPLLLIKIPTRSRPEQFFHMLDLYYKKLSNKVRYHFLITCDIDDKTMNNKRVRKKFEEYKHRNLTVNFSRNLSKIEAYNKDMDLAPAWDIVLVTSDDMEPVADGYDKIIVDRMKKHFPRYDGVLNFNDGHLNGELNTLPIVGKNFYKHFGYIYYPGYVSFYCDNELTFISRMLKKEAYFAQVIIKHNHPYWNAAKWDELYAKNQPFYEKDEQLFRARKAQDFYLKKVIRSTRRERQ